MRVFLFCIIFVIIGNVHVVSAAISPTGLSAIERQALIENILAQIAKLRAELAIIKKQTHIISVEGPRQLSVGEYGEWKIITNKNTENSHTEINWGDGMTSVSGLGHIYANPGKYSITFTVFDGSGKTSLSTFEVEVKGNNKSTKYSPWGTRLGVSNGNIPTGSFKSYFFNVKTFATLVPPAVVKRPYFSYPQDSLGGWSGGDHTLGAYWVSQSNFAKETSLKIDFSNPQWDVVRVYVDGKELTHIDGGYDQEFERIYRFSAGTHTIEIEYQTNWHAGTFAARIANVEEKYFAYEEALTSAYAVAGPKAELIDRHEYSSENQKEGVVAVSVPNTTSNKVLVLSSYDPVLWQTSLLKERGVKAIVLASFAGAAEIENQGIIPVYRVRGHYDE